MLYFKKIVLLFIFFVTIFVATSEVFVSKASSNFDGFRSFANNDLGMILGTDWEPHAMHSYSSDNYFMDVIDEDRFLYSGKEYVDYYIAIHQAMLRNRLSGNYGFIYRVHVSPGDWTHNWIVRRKVKSKEISSHVQFRTKNEYQLLYHEPQQQPTQESGSMGISLNSQGIASLGFNYNWKLEDLTVNTNGTSAANRRYGAKFILRDKATSYTTGDQYYYGLFVFSYTPDYSVCSGQSYQCYAMKRPFVDMKHDITLHAYNSSAFTPARSFTGWYYYGLATYREAKLNNSHTLG
jgi:hypothetical protein